MQVQDPPAFIAPIVWADHQRAQLLRLSRLSLAEKLTWLEEAHAIVQQLQRQRARQEATGAPSRQPEP